MRNTPEPPSKKINKIKTLPEAAKTPTHDGRRSRFDHDNQKEGLSTVLNSNIHVNSGMKNINTAARLEINNEDSIHEPESPTATDGARTSIKEFTHELNEIEASIQGIVLTGLQSINTSPMKQGEFSIQSI